MGKSDEKQTKERAFKAVDGESKHKATCGESEQRKHNPSVEAFGSSPFAMTLAYKATDSESKHKNNNTLGSSPFRTTHLEDNNDDGKVRDSKWRDRFRQLCEYKVQFGHCAVPKQYSANPTLAAWVSTQRTRYRNNNNNTKENEKPTTTTTTAERIRALDGIGFYWGAGRTDWASI